MQIFQVPNAFFIKNILARLKNRSSQINLNNDKCFLIYNKDSKVFLWAVFSELHPNRIA